MSTRRAPKIPNLYFAIEKSSDTPGSEPIRSPILSRPRKLSHEMSIAPAMTPQMLPMPPTMTMTSTITEIWKEKLVGKIPLMKDP
jgi:hypothetical protein